MSSQTLLEYSATNNTAAHQWALWATGNGTVPVLIIAFSLGATQAYCITGFNYLGSLDSGNYACIWLPVSRLTQVDPSEEPLFTR